MNTDTIFAQASAFGKSGVTVFRISGPHSLSIAQAISNRTIFVPRRVHICTIVHPTTSQMIDQGLIIYFPHPKSFTGEDVIEIHTHGSIAVSKILTSCLLAMQTLRLAKPGEFARRAFLNGKIDLTTAEGIADLIDAETAMQHRQAVRQIGGELERLYNGWRDMIIKILSLLEAYIDFPDEEVPISVIDDANNVVNILIAQIEEHLGDSRRGERLRNGITVAIIGNVNVGKSSLLNYLTMRDAAIVSSIPGTTRDVIETCLDIGGYPIMIRDTAGIRDSSDPVEQEGIRRSILTAKDADIKILMIDATNMEQIVDDKVKELLVDDNAIIVVNKIDLVKYKYNNPILTRPFVAISLKEHFGLDKLTANIIAYAEKIAAPGELPAITRERYRSSLSKALGILRSINLSDDLVLVAEDLRIIARCIESITGRIKVDDILDAIFNSFCIGK